MISRRLGATCFSLLILSGLGANTAGAWITIGFEDEPLPPGTARPATAVDQRPIVSQGARFNRDWNVEFDCCPSGWAVSNQTDQLAPGPAGAYAAFVRSTGGGGFNSAHFAVANNLQRGEARIEFADPVEVQGMYVTNVTYAYLATVEGDDGAGFVKGPFQLGDWLRLDVIGLDRDQQETGRQPIFLVDYRDGRAAALDEWTWFDLSSLGADVTSLEFELESTDVGMFGMNTPAYFAIDDLTLRVVPEPDYGEYVLLIPATAMVLYRRRGRTAGVVSDWPRRR